MIDVPFALPPTSLEIIIDLPAPPSANRIWRHARGHVYKSQEYVKWQKDADVTVLSCKHCRGKRIDGPFEIAIYLGRAFTGDGDNRIKPLLDWLQSREFVLNDKDCQQGSWKWVPTSEAPLGCRVHLRSLHQ